MSFSDRLSEAVQLLSSYHDAKVQLTKHCQSFRAVSICHIKQGICFESGSRQLVKRLIFPRWHIRRTLYGRKHNTIKKCLFIKGELLKCLGSCFRRTNLGYFPQIIRDRFGAFNKIQFKRRSITFGLDFETSFKNSSHHWNNKKESNSICYPSTFYKIID